MPSTLGGGLIGCYVATAHDAILRTLDRDLDGFESSTMGIRKQVPPNERRCLRHVALLPGVVCDVDGAAQGGHDADPARLRGIEVSAAVIFFGYWRRSESRPISKLFRCEEAR